MNEKIAIITVFGFIIAQTLCIVKFSTCKKEEWSQYDSWQLLTYVVCDILAVWVKP